MEATEKQIIAGCVVMILLLFGGLIYDKYCTPTHTKTIIPISVDVNNEYNGIVMDECLNVYPVFCGSCSYGSKESNIKLIYCKEHNTPCEITIADHLLGNTGISSVRIVNDKPQSSCEST